MQKSFIPNSLTFGNLICGVLSIQFTMQGNFKVAAALILLAGVFDRYDGTVARFLGVDSPLGKELDSLADLVSFGVAPSLLIFTLCELSSLGMIGYITLIIFPVAGAYRLARYNTTVAFNNVFTGIPITIAGSFIAVYALFIENNIPPMSFSVILMIIFSGLMVSKLQIKKR
ncbi:CDP-diacylglycerol--serine O-phosphatidyltransferase [Clostridium senegalense]|uniref:CDP-diacylglycerol--serine O-phosphatidyltransferase n=1 Tax=Clostridium senegalense TaxID=1465809 RepID=UPI000289F678|nr:CDP-diacylglycerol--serine O-phosphatidyltransferase [Clostridium senegalense]